jgi:hypothetical protein
MTTYAWFFHHCVPLEPLHIRDGATSESVMAARHAEIDQIKPAHERAVRHAALRIVQHPERIPDAVVLAGSVYLTALGAYYHKFAERGDTPSGETMALFAAELGFARAMQSNANIAILREMFNDECPDTPFDWEKMTLVFPTAIKEW